MTKVRKKIYDTTNIPQNSQESLKYQKDALNDIPAAKKEYANPFHSILDGFLARIDKQERNHGYIIILVLLASLLPSCKVIEAAHNQKVDDYRYCYEQTEEECQDFNSWQKPCEWSQTLPMVDKEFERKASIGGRKGKAQ